MPRYLVGRVVDPILGLSTGVLAYVLWENDGRNSEHRPEGRKLTDLVQRKWNGIRPPAELLSGSQTENSHTSAPQYSASTTQRMV